MRGTALSVGFLGGTRALGFPQHIDEHRPQYPILFAVDQRLAEGAALRVAPELSDPVGSLEVGKHEDVKQLGAGSWAKRVQRAVVGRPWPMGTVGTVSGGFRRVGVSAVVVRVVVVPGARVPFAPRSVRTSNEERA